MIERYESITVKDGVFKIKTKQTTAGESVDIYFMNSVVATVQESGLASLYKCIADIAKAIDERNKLNNKK